MKTLIKLLSRKTRIHSKNNVPVLFIKRISSEKAQLLGFCVGLVELKQVKTDERKDDNNE